MKTTFSKIPNASMLAFAVIFLSVVFLMPTKAHASNLISQQPDFSTQITGGNSSYEQTISTSTAPTFIGNQTIGSGSIVYKSTITQTVQISIDNVTDSVTFIPVTSFTVDSTNGQYVSKTFFATSFVTLLPTKLYRLVITNTGSSSTFFLAGTTSSGYSGCQQAFNPCNNSVTAIAFSLFSSNSISFASPVQYDQNNISAPSGIDFNSWIIQLSGVITTSTPLVLTVQTSGGSDAIILPASSTDISLIQNLTVPKSYTLSSISSTTPTIYSAVATLTYQNSGAILTSRTSYFGVFANGAAFTQDNFFTTSGYIAPQDIQASSTGCARFATSSLGSIVARDFCNVAAFILIPPTGFMQTLSSFPTQMGQKWPFVYLSDIQAAYSSFDPNSPHYIAPGTDPNYQDYATDIKASGTVMNLTIIHFATDASSTPAYSRGFFTTMRTALVFLVYAEFIYVVFWTIYRFIASLFTSQPKP